MKLNLQNDKWLVNCSYNPHQNTIKTPFFANYKKVIILWDYNVEVTDNHMKSFYESYGSKSS